LNEVVDVNIGPHFAFDAKEGCVGVCDLVKTVEVDDPCCDVENGDDDGAMRPVNASSNQDDVENDSKAPPRKRPKNKEEETTKEGNDVDLFDLNKCTSLEELIDIGPEKMKTILLSMGVKCG
jgi:hypothetical protein